MNEEALQKPPERKKVTLTLEDETTKDVALFMSFGLLNTLAIPIQNVEQLIEIDENPDVRTFILKSCLSTRNEHGQVVNEFDTNTITYSEGEEILAWARGHLTDFFITRLVNKIATQKKVIQTINQR